MNRLTGLAAALTVLLVPPAASAAVNPLPFEQRAGVATCLRAPGAPGDLALYGHGGADLRAAGDSGAARLSGVRLGNLVECAAVATAPGGAGVVAGAVVSGEVRAAVRDPGGAFGSPVRLGDAPPFGPSVAAAVSPAGHAVVAWAQVRGRPDLRRSARFRIVAVRRAPGGLFGAVEPLTGWRRGPSIASAAVEAAVDGAGTATVAWAHPQRERRVFDRADIGVATAAPGTPFAAQRLADDVSEPSRPALAVAADGWTLLAHDGEDGIRAYERAPGATQLTEVLAADVSLAAHVTVAVRDGGGGLVAWRTDASAGAGAQAVVREGPGAFARPRTVARDVERFDTGGFVAFAATGGPPYDPEAGMLRGALAPDGRALLAWPAARRGFGRTSTSRLAAGTLAGGLAAPVELGSLVRDVEGVAPLFLPDGRAALAWTDNAGHVEASVPSGPGRLHLAVESAPPLPPPPPAPRVTLRAPRTQRLYASQNPRVTATCAQECDLRASIVAPRRSAMTLVETLRAGRPARLRFATFEPAEALRVVARATAPGGRASTRATVRVRVITRPPLPVPETLDVRVRRRGRTIAVSWRAASPARRTYYLVEGRRRRGGRFDVTDLGTIRVRRGRGRTSFHARLRPRRPARVRWVAVTAYSLDGPPPSDPVIVKVP
jgi:hypothetical protein